MAITCVYLTVMQSVVTGFHPVFNEEFEFELNVPELAIIRFLVKDYQDYRSNVMVAQYTLPFSCMMSG